MIKALSVGKENVEWHPYPSDYLFLEYNTAPLGNNPKGVCRLY